MNLFQDIFGGSTSTSTPINMNPATQALTPEYMPFMASTIAGGPPSYTGPLTTTPTGTENTMMSNIFNQVAPTNPTMQQTNAAAGGAFLPGGQYFNPFVQPAISAATAPIYQAMGQTLTQNLPAQFAAGGQQVQNSGIGAGGQPMGGNPTGAIGSTAFSNASAIATESANQAAATAASNIENNAFNTGVGATTAFAGLYPGEVQSMVSGLQANLLPTLLTEQGITNGLQAFQENVQSLLGFMQAATQAFSPIVANQTTSTSTPGILGAFKSAGGGGNSSAATSGTGT